MIGTVLRLPDDEARIWMENPQDVYGLIKNGNHPELDLDKSWDGLRYLLTKRFPEETLAGFLGEVGQAVGDDLGYGPGQAYLSTQVATIAHLLDRTTVDDLRAIFSPAEMMSDGVYPQIWDRDPAVDDAFGYLASYFEDLKKFVSESKGYTIVTWVP